MDLKIVQRKQLHGYSVRLPENTIEKLRIAAYIYGKSKQKIMDELILSFYNKIVLTNDRDDA